MTGEYPPPPLNIPIFGMEDFASAIAYEVKQEIANRYFGFRTRIENQSKEYLANLQDAERGQHTAIRLDLCRMQFLVQVPRLFCSFLSLVDLPRDYALTLCRQQAFMSGQELFSAIRGKGFTRWQRFRSIAILIYHSLAAHIAAYHDRYLELEEEHREICMEIDKFQRQNDLTDILCFLRSLDAKDSERLKFLHANTVFKSGNTLDGDLKLAPPPSVAETLIMLTPLPPLEKIKGQFTEILKQALDTRDCPNPSMLPF